MRRRRRIEGRNNIIRTCSGREEVIEVNVARGSGLVRDSGHRHPGVRHTEDRGAVNVDPYNENTLRS